MTTRTADEGPLDARAELSEFLRTRRARLQPDDAGVQSYGRRRRVPGLRREELAQLAGVSVAYYTRLEQGNASNVSAEVLEAIARALRLSESERAHLFHLAKPQSLSRRRSTPRAQQVRPGLAQMLDLLDGVPAYVWGRRTDILAWNPAAAAVFGHWIDRPAHDRNWARIVFLDAHAHDFFVDWDTKAFEVVGQLRLDAGMHGDDPLLASLIGELSVRSADFRRLWAAHDVKRQSFGELRIRHQLVGELPLRYETLLLPDDQEQALTVYHADPGPALQSLRLITSRPAEASAQRAPAS